ncbi:hypothetical protein AB670_01965 [Chryseobacterium sp. MOF25P]|nr:hypothetical protein AB670_01965 [Chryseobacterium sp. MOF25P]
MQSAQSLIFKILKTFPFAKALRSANDNRKPWLSETPLRSKNMQYKSQKNLCEHCVKTKTYFKMIQ